MFEISKITANSTIDFAAEELKKYLRMMMPKAGEIEISYNPKAENGFRIGLMQDFGFDCSDAANTELDDIVYIDCDTEGGIIAGDNPRATLIAVYEYFRKNGCRWLFPGVDGEYVPMKAIEAVNYRHKASCRYRGPCVEGAMSQQVIMETIDFMPKVGMNVLQMQFLVPTVFYNRYYDRLYNNVLESESVSNDMMLQWKTACECEMAKRGIQFHDVGHGWTAAPFDIDSSSGWESVSSDAIPPENREFVAMLSGKRELYKGQVLNTQFCMSNPEARKKVVDYITEYAKMHSNVGYLHVWLGDAYNNHCECEKCVEKNVSDWYIIFLNELDRELTKNKLNTRIVFIAYTETTWAPENGKIDNLDRFTLMIAPISRSYTKTITNIPENVPPFVRNKIVMPPTLDEYMAHYKNWRKVYDGAALAFEYHFWKHQYFDLSGLRLAERIYEDIETYKAHGLDGLIACGTQRAYFPSGYAYYVFARKQFDMALSLDDIKEDYFSYAYGQDWKEFYNYLNEIEGSVNFKYLEREMSEDTEISLLYSPSCAEKIKKMPEIVARGKELIKKYYNSDIRIQTVSVRLLEMHAEYCRLYADALYYKALGNDEEAFKKAELMYEYTSKIEPLVERYFDVYFANKFADFGMKLQGVPKVSTLD